MPKPRKLKSSRPSKVRVQPLIGPPLDRSFDDHVARVFEYYRKEYFGGCKEALIDALKFGLLFNTAFPEWVRIYAGNALGSYEQYLSLTLDEAFEVKRKLDPRTISAERKAIATAGEVTCYIYAKMREGQSRNEDFFEQVGERFGISKNRVKDYWLRGNAALGLRPPRRRTFSRAKK